MQLRNIPYLILNCSKMFFPMWQLHIAFFLLLVFFIVPRVSWLVSPSVGNIILVIAFILSVFAFARLWKLMVERRSSTISWGPLPPPSIINFGGALLLNELSYRPRIGRILKSKDNSLKWDQSEIYNFIRFEAVLL